MEKKLFNYFSFVIFWNSHHLKSCVCTTNWPDKYDKCKKLFGKLLSRGKIKFRHAIEGHKHPNTYFNFKPTKLGKLKNRNSQNTSLTPLNTK
jgi:hypothetical protein